jgi:hypothetical protein
MQRSHHPATHVLESGGRGPSWRPAHRPQPLLGTLLLLASILMCLAYITLETRSQHVETPDRISVTVGLDGSVNVKRNELP